MGDSDPKFLVIMFGFLRPPTTFTHFPTYEKEMILDVDLQGWTIQRTNTGLGVENHPSTLLNEEERTTNHNRHITKYDETDCVDL